MRYSTYVNKGWRLVLLCILLATIAACCSNKPVRIAEKGPMSYTGSDYKGNYVWGGAMNLAWNELTDNIIAETIELNTTDEAALETLSRLNNPVFTKDDMDEASYYVKSGYGQKTVDTINRECRAKFPGKSIADLQLKLAEKDIISYAYFLKEIEYAIQFAKQDIRFMDETVPGFAANADSYENIYILDYTSEDKFLVGIKLKDNRDQIFLAKGYPMDKPDEVVQALQAKVAAQMDKDYQLGTIMNRKDIFQAPMLHLSHEKSYEEMIGKGLKNKKFSDYYINIMKEIVKFDMDEKGARVENEAIIGMVTSAGPGDTYKPRVMILDKPYWVMMKRASSNNPYFLLGVGNTSLMKASE